MNNAMNELKVDRTKFSNLFNGEVDRVELIKKSIKLSDSTLKTNVLCDDKLIDDIFNDDIFKNESDKTKFLSITKFATDENIRNFDIDKVKELVELMEGVELIYDEINKEYPNIDMIHDLIINTKHDVLSIESIKNEQSVLNDNMEKLNKVFDSELCNIHREFLKGWNVKMSKDSDVLTSEVVSNIVSSSFDRLLIRTINNNTTEENVSKYIKEKLVPSYKKCMSNKDMMRIKEKRFIRYCEGEKYMSDLGVMFPNIMYIIKGIDSLFPDGIVDSNGKYLYATYVNNLLFHIYSLTDGLVKVSKRSKKNKKVYSIKSNEIVTYSIFMILDMFKRITEPPDDMLEIEVKLLDTFKKSLIKVADDLIKSSDSVNSELT